MPWIIVWINEKITVVNGREPLIILTIKQMMFSENINAAKYRDEILTPFLNQLDDDELVYGYFQQNGATTYTTIDFLAEFYDNRILLARIHTTRRWWDLAFWDSFVVTYKNVNVYNTLKWLEQIAEYDNE